MVMCYLLETACLFLLPQTSLSVALSKMCMNARNVYECMNACAQRRGAKEGNKPSTMRVCLALPLLGIHLRPHNPVVFRGSYPFKDGEKANLEEGFPLRCFQQFSLPNIATRRCIFYNRHTRGWSTPVLSY